MGPDRCRWGGYAARLAEREPDRWIAQVLSWKDAWWRHTLRSMHATDGMPPNRSGRGHRCLGKRRADDALQVTANERAEEPWQCTTLDRNVWHSLEVGFIARVNRVEPRSVQPIPQGRHMLEDRVSGSQEEWT